MNIDCGIRCFLRALGACRKGVTAIELAFTAPIIIFTLIGMIELLMIMFVNTLMEGALREASRFGITGYVPEGTDRETMIADIIYDHTLGLVEIQPGTIQTLVYNNFDVIGDPEPLTVDVNGNGQYDAADGDEFEDVNGNGTWDQDQGADGVGDAGEVVLYTVNHEWHTFTPLLAHLIGDNGVVTLTASVAVRNEPFGNDE